jgi:hypothetical protein
MLAAIDDVVAAFDDIGGTSARVTGVQPTTEPFDWSSKASDDDVPTIHVGWTRDIKSLNNGRDAGAVTLPLHSKTGCRMLGAHIAFPDEADPGAMRWDYGTPFTTAGRAWYAAGETDTSGKTWFRPSFLHELLHAFDFHHLQNQYSFMTHRSPAGFPWANRAAQDAVRPLPYDIGRLRRLYPASGATTDVALLNTWYGPPTDPDDNAGGQYQLCLPSSGSAVFPMPTWGAECGIDPGAGFGTPGSATAVCSGTQLQTRVTIANGSTTAVDLTAKVYFSDDDRYDATDKASATTHALHVDAATSQLADLGWTVPGGLSLTSARRPIVRITGTGVAPDWIPLGATVRCA